MLHNESSNDDLFENTYLLFLDALHTAILPTADQSAKTGGLGPGIAWELRADLCNRGTELLTLFRDRLSPEEHTFIARYIADLGQLPSRVFEGTGEGLLAPEWTEQRKRTEDVLRLLESRVRAIYTRFNLDLSWFEVLVK